MWKLYGNIYSTFRDMAILYIDLITHFAFVFHWFFILFLGLNNIAYCTLRSTTFLLFDLGHWYLACIFINLSDYLTVNGSFAPVTLTFDLKVKLLTNMKILCLAHNFLSLGLDLNLWHVVRLNQVNLQYAIECDIEPLLQGQVIHNWKRKYSISRHALIFCMLVQNLYKTIIWHYMNFPFSYFF